MDSVLQTIVDRLRMTAASFARGGSGVGYSFASVDLFQDITESGIQLEDVVEYSQRTSTPIFLSKWLWSNVLFFDHRVTTGKVK